MGIFNTFFMGGYECADHINRSGERVNLLNETQHDIRVEDDYRLLAATGIKVVREGICWSAVESQPGIFDFTEVLHRIKTAEKFGIQQIWDLIHFGYPDDIFPTHPLFCHRFEKLCEAFALFYKVHSKQQLFVVPINEISFLSWHSGDVRGTVPFAVNSGWDIKYHLCKAAILGINILKEIIPDCRLLLVEPLIKVHAGATTESGAEALHNEHQFQAMDIIAGRMCPELGGSEDFLDILGFNYYWNCQWECDGEPLCWPDADHKRIGLSALLKQAYERYRKPMILSETGHFGTGRIEWISEIMEECLSVVRSGIPLLGVCIYPVIDRPDWDRLDYYTNSGIWDLDEHKNRIAHPGYIEALTAHQVAFTMQKFEKQPFLSTAT
jgi:beta-glucosidase/6-phospho-beta-glucosidase/beta-galactosidase